MAAVRRLRLRDQHGQGLVEYALIISVVALGSLSALVFMRDEVKGLFSKAGSSIAAGAGSTTGGSTGSIPVAGTISITCPGAGCEESETSTASPGIWGGSPAPTFTYQWATNTDSGATCNTSSSGWTNLGTASTQLLPNISGSDSVRVIVTGTNASGSVSAVGCRIFDSN